MRPESELKKLQANSIKKAKRRETEIWNDVRKRGDIKSFEFFLADFPNSRYKEEALQRIQELKAEKRFNSRPPPSPKARPQTTKSSSCQTKFNSQNPSTLQK